MRILRSSRSPRARRFDADAPCARGNAGALRESRLDIDVRATASALAAPFRDRARSVRDKPSPSRRACRKCRPASHRHVHRHCDRSSRAREIARLDDARDHADADETPGGSSASPPPVRSISACSASTAAVNVRTAWRKLRRPSSVQNAVGEPEPATLSRFARASRSDICSAGARSSHAHSKAKLRRIAPNRMPPLCARGRGESVQRQA